MVSARAPAQQGCASSSCVCVELDTFAVPGGMLLHGPVYVSGSDSSVDNRSSRLSLGNLARSLHWIRSHAPCLLFAQVNPNHNMHQLHIYALSRRSTLAAQWKVSVARRSCT